MQKFSSLMSFVLAFCTSIVCGAMTGVYAGEFGDAFVPIQDSTSKDPAGFQLMIVSIGILVVMVMSIFIVTTIYLMKGKKQPKSTRAE